jgi:uncharacterized protein (DUF433 family)
MERVAIIDRGRGPELEGTRITVYCLLPYFEEGMTDAAIAKFMELSTAQVTAMRKFFAEHEEEVLAENRVILAKIAKGNPPEIKALDKVAHAKLKALRKQLQQQRREGANAEGHTRRR